MTQRHTELAGELGQVSIQHMGYDETLRECVPGDSMGDLFGMVK